MPDAANNRPACKMPDMAALLSDHRFWESVSARSANSDSGCVLWMGGKDRKGYPVARWKIKHWYVHRLVLMRKLRQAIPPHILACHSCDTPGCINPDHLWPGSISDNNKDAAEKKRSRGAQGLNNGQSTLTREQVLAIRTSDMTDRAMANFYGVAINTIWKARTGRSYQNIPMPHHNRREMRHG